MEKTPIARAIEGQGHKGVLTAVIQCERPASLLAQAQRYAWADSRGVIRRASDLAAAAALAAVLALQPAYLKSNTDTVWIEHTNAYVNTGLNNAGDREFGLGGTAVGYFGVSSNSGAVTAATLYGNGSSAGTAANTIIKAISPAATRTGQVVTAGTTFTNADFTSGVFIWNKVFMVTTSTDAGTGLVDVIGGSGGSAPYNRTFSMDLTAVGNFSVTAQIAVTLVAV